MKNYRVTSYYLATGMEGIAAEKDYGIVEANTEEEAKEKIVKQEYPVEEYYGPDNKWKASDFHRGCLRVEEIK